MIGRRRFLVASTALMVAAICLVTASMLDSPDAPKGIRAPHETPLGPGPWSVNPRTDTPPALPASSTITMPRPVFRLSIIPGGAYTRSELQQAALRLPDVADHYRNVPIERMVPAKLSRDGEYYVSYKKGGHVYWTSYKVRLPQGEPVMTDGAESIRARCGNRLSEVPKEPRLPAPLEPPEMEFARVEVPTLPATPLIQPPGSASSWLPVVIPWIPLLVSTGGGHHDVPPGPTVPEPSPVVLLAIGLAFVLGARYLMRR